MSLTGCFALGIKFRLKLNKKGFFVVWVYTKGIITNNYKS